MTPADLDIVIKANVNAGLQGLSSINTKLDQTKVSAGGATDAVTKTATGINNIAAVSAKASQGLSQQVTATSQLAAGFTDVSAALKSLGLENLNTELEKVSSGGVGSIERLTAALDILHQASAKSIDPSEIKIFSSAIDQVSEAIDSVNQRQISGSSLSKSLADAAIGANNLDSSLANLGSGGLPLLKLNESVQQLLLSFDELPASVKQLADTGTGNINEFAAAFDFLRQKAAGSVDAQELSGFNSALNTLGGNIVEAKSALTGFESGTTSLRAQILEARNALDALSQSGTASATELAAAGQKLGELKGRLKETNTIAAAFDPVQKFRGLSNVLGAGIGSLSSITGAMGLFGDESEKTRTKFIQLQSVLLLTAGINQLLEAKEAFTSLRLAAIETFTTIKADAIASLGAVGAALAATGIVAAAVAIGYLATRENEAGKEAERAAKAQKDYDDAIASTLSSANTELTKLSALVQVSRDTSLSYGERKKAIDELNKSYPELQNNLTVEEINSKKDKTAIDNLADSLLRKAKAQALSNLLTKASEDLIKAQNSSAIDNIDNIDALIAGALHLGNVSATADALVVKGTKTKNKAIEDFTKTVSELSKQFGDLTQVQSKSGDFEVKVKGLSDLQKAHNILKELKIDREGLKTDITVGDLDKPLKDIELLQSAIKKLQAIKGTQSIIIKLKAEIDDESLAAVGGQLKKQFGDLKNLKLPDIEFPPVKAPIEFVVPNEETQAAILKEQVRSLSEKLHISLPVNFEALNKEELKAILDAIPTDVKIKLGLTGDQTGFKEFIKNLADSQKAIDDLNTSIANTTLDTITSAFADFGKAIGAQGNPFAALFKVFSQGLESLGKSLIEYGVEVGIIQKIFANPLNPISPALAIGAGIALEALASLLQSKVSHFAEGGIVTAPILGLIGERGKEVVIPLDRIHEVLNLDNGNSVFIAENRISGQDIVTAFKRADKHNRRTY